MRPVGMVFRPGKGSASNVGRQAAEGSEVAPLWLLWGLGATLRPAQAHNRGGGLYVVKMRRV